jgi:hypothetical protein
LQDTELMIVELCVKLAEACMRDALVGASKAATTSSLQAEQRQRFKRMHFFTRGRCAA